MRRCLRAHVAACWRKARSSAERPGADGDRRVPAGATGCRGGCLRVCVCSLGLNEPSRGSKATFRAAMNGSEAPQIAQPAGIVGPE